MATNAIVIVKDNNLTNALRLLKKKLKDEKTMIEFQKHLEFEKPSAKRRRKKLNGIKRMQSETMLHNQ